MANKILFKNETLELWFTPSNASHRYILYHQCPGFKQEVARGERLTKNITKHLTQNELRQAKAKLHGIKFVLNRFA